jgi:hypothetical protein
MGDIVISIDSFFTSQPYDILNSFQREIKRDRKMIIFSFMDLWVALDLG